MTVSSRDIPKLLESISLKLIFLAKAILRYLLVFPFVLRTKVSKKLFDLSLNPADVND